MDLEKIEKLNELKEKGMITQQEYDEAKAKALGGGASAAPTMDMDNRTYSMLMHFAQLCGYLLPMCGWVAPLVLWLIRRDDPYINEQGKVVFNWIISSFIYHIICFMLWFVVIGIFMTVILAVISIIFAVIGAVRAKDGVIQNYPMSISFFAVNPNIDE
ncbi:DUF4870 domain-containing protein [Gilvimarinus agarilyticus]|uniref:DUF4870 domain-containing protein n=1 Tax=unclassified Gilvimarinus TaxID=2642066 RepID=UPI001C0A1C79|nr:MULTISPECIES: DUF4870 domain-containing protein [unclassified Gilvimarinus]MBU2884345.1 DUF4870 domain-containing protein [Gilvimarinus agarilyticus]MDO6569481.1 DUF4870 domain-containing protein [Gilvimarinus sp. 2_MG-2023]MDO6748620.1 DUF4870 domain-containing protein [Gilvimarinus sp. 1_MG-2023]